MLFRILEFQRIRQGFLSSFVVVLENVYICRPKRIGNDDFIEWHQKEVEPSFESVEKYIDEIKILFELKKD